MRKWMCLFLVSLFVSIHTGTMAQLPDGVTATPAFLEEIKKNYSGESSLSLDLNQVNSSANLPLQIHIIKNSNGAAGVVYSDLQTNVGVANTYFKPIGIHFFVESIDIINDYHYAFITNDYNKTELLTKHAIANKINVYLVDSILLGTTLSYGFTYFPNAPDSNYIFLTKKEFTGNALAAMLGHFMGLLSTHETLGGQELASEKNCDSSGDFICDTYADPDLYQQVDDSCLYTGSMKDGNGKFFVPSVANLMSNSKDACKCLFTPMQYRRMYFYFRKYRQYLR